MICVATAPTAASSLSLGVVVTVEDSNHNTVIWYSSEHNLIFIVLYRNDSIVKN